MRGLRSLRPNAKRVNLRSLGFVYFPTNTTSYRESCSSCNRGARRISVVQTSKAFSEFPKMPLYFFNLRDETTEMKDEEGLEFANLADAETHARLVHNELTRHTTPGRHPKRMLVVVDAEGNDLLEIPFN